MLKNIVDRVKEIKGGEKATFNEILLISLIFFGFMVVFTSVYRSNDSLSARNMEVEGVVKSIVWRTRNHGDPRIIVKDLNGEEKILSHYTIVLKPKELKVGDYIVKIKGDVYCTINNQFFRFSWK